MPESYGEKELGFFEIVSYFFEEYVGGVKFGEDFLNCKRISTRKIPALKVSHPKRLENLINRLHFQLVLAGEVPRISLALPVRTILRQAIVRGSENCKRKWQKSKIAI